MTYTTPTPSTVSAGDTFPASAYNIISADLQDHESRLVAMSGVYTNEAARDAAITSPTEGMRAYITASTVAAATGSITRVPTGIQTIYNGSAWVCVTEVAAGSETLSNFTSSIYTNTFLGDTTVISVTLSTGTSAFVTYHQGGYTGNTLATFTGVAVSGATTIAASDSVGTFSPTIGSSAAGIYFPNLTAGINTFTLQMRSTTYTIQYASNRHLCVKGIA
jgi:hypothetical protein